MTRTSRGSARAVADLTRGMIVATVEIDAEPDRVFAALSTPEVAQWWGSADTYQVQHWSMDLRAGGAWRSDGVGADGRQFSVSGQVLEVDPPWLLVQTWQYDWGASGSTTVRYQIERTEHGSRLTVRHEGFADNAPDCEAHATGWELVLGWLVGHLLNQRPS